MTPTTRGALVCCAVALLAACAAGPNPGTTYPTSRKTPGFSVLYLSRLAHPVEVSTSGHTLLDLARPANSVKIAARTPRAAEVDSRIGRADQAFAAELRDLLAGPARGPAHGFETRRLDGVDAKEIAAEVEANRFTSDDLLVIWPNRSDLACADALGGGSACEVRLSFMAILYDGETMERLWSGLSGAAMQKDSAMGFRDDPARPREATQRVWSDLLAQMRTAGIVD